MRRRSRTRRVMKWVGTGLCTLIIGVWASDVRTRVMFGERHAAVLWKASLVLVNGEAGVVEEVASMFLRRSDYEFVYWTLESFAGGGVNFHIVPLWMPLLLIALPTAFLWYLDRRRWSPPGHCQHCGYNRTGNVSGRCPECGQAT